MSGQEDRKHQPTGGPALSKPLVLVGLPGSGKSTVGRHLARRLGLPFIDSDHEIERRLGCTISAYFEREGEQAFRDVEEQVIAELVQSPGVLATGGGAVIRPGTRQRLRERGWVLYLHSTPEDVYRRVRHDRKRPLLQVEDPLARLRGLYEQRDPLYREASHFCVDTGRPSVANVVGRIVMQLELSGPLATGP